MDVLLDLGDLIVSEPLSAAVLIIFVLQWLNARGAERDDRNISNAIALASAVVTTFEPVKQALDAMIARMTMDNQGTQRVIQTTAQEAQRERLAVTQRIEKAVSAMSAVTIRRDEQHQAVIEQLDTQQQTLMNRLDKHGTMIQTLIRDIKAAAIPDSIRGDITLLISLATGISQDVKLLRPPQAPEPGETKSAPDPEGSTESNKETKPYDSE